MSKFRRKAAPPPPRVNVNTVMADPEKAAEVIDAVTDPLSTQRFKDLARIAEECGIPKKSAIAIADRLQGTIG